MSGRNGGFLGYSCVGLSVIRWLCRVCVVAMGLKFLELGFWIFVVGFVGLVSNLVF